MSTTYLEFLAMLENSYGEELDDSLKKELALVFTPKGDCPVAISPNFVFLLSHLLRGVDPQQASDLLNKEKKEYIAPSVIRDYLTKYVPPSVVRSHYITKWLDKSGNVDELHILESLVKIQYSRVLERVDKPVMDDEDRESRRRDIQLLGKLALDSLRAKVDVGWVPAAPVKHEVHHTGVTTKKVEVSIKENLSIDPRRAARILGVLNRIEEVQDLLGVDDDEKPSN